MDSDNPLHELSPDECWERLGTHELGRIVTVVGGHADIFPVNYAVDGQSIVFRTAEGSKLVELTINDSVLFEADHYSETEAWSVVVRGHAERVTSPEVADDLDALPLRPMVPTVKRNFVRIVPESVSGRSFQRTPEPSREEGAEL